MALAPFPDSKLTLSFHFNGLALEPKVVFDPVGRITPGVLEKYFRWLKQQVVMAQSKQRSASVTVPPTLVPQVSGPSELHPQEHLKRRVK